MVAGFFVQNFQLSLHSTKLLYIFAVQQTKRDMKNLRIDSLAVNRVADSLEFVAKVSTDHGHTDFHGTYLIKSDKWFSTSLTQSQDGYLVRDESGELPRNWQYQVASAVYSHYKATS